jgi:hypothetical protein
VVLPLQTLELWAPCKARWLLEGAVAKYLLLPRAPAMYLIRVRVAGRVLRGGRATASAYLSFSNAACACGTKPRRGPPTALPGANRAMFFAVNRHKREVNDFAGGINSRRGPPAALPEADMWRHAWGDGEHCPCAARHAANENIFPRGLLFRVFYKDSKREPGSAVPDGRTRLRHSCTRSTVLFLDRQPFPAESSL